MSWGKITVIGVGQLGGSLGLAIKKRDLAQQVIGLVHRAEHIDRCVEKGAVDQATLDIATAVKDADLIILCTHLGLMRGLAEKMCPYLKSGAIVTDVGSVKGSVVRDLESLVAATGAHFVGSHPMAGTEKSGLGVAWEDLFNNAVCVITPTSTSNGEAVRKVENFWRALGARPVCLASTVHDELVARCSHLPHITAAVLANYVLRPEHVEEQALLCAGGFRDTTRIASGSPAMWRDIALANREKVSAVLDVFIADLRTFQTALRTADAKTVEDFFVTAKHRRDGWGEKKASSSPE